MSSQLPPGPIFEDVFTASLRRLCALQAVAERDPVRTFCCAGATGVTFGSVAVDADGVSAREHWLPQGFDDHRAATAVAFHPKGTVIAVAEQRAAPRLHLFTWPDRKPLQRIDNVGRLSIADMCWNRTGTHFAVLTGAPLHNVIVYEVEPTGRLRTTPIASQREAPNDHQYTDIRFNPRTPQELTTSGGGHVTLWKIDDAGVLTSTEVVASDVTARFTCHAHLRHGQILAGAANGHVYIIDGPTGTVLHALSLGDSPIASVIMTKHTVVVALEKGELVFLTLDAAVVLHRVDCQLVGRVTGAIFTALDTFVVTSDSGQTAAVILPGFTAPTPMSADEIKLLAAKVIPVEESFGTAVAAVAVGPSSVVAVDSNGVLRARDVDANRLLLRMHIGASPTAMLALPDGTVMTAHATGTVRFVNVAAGRITHQLNIRESEQRVAEPQLLFAPSTADGTVKGSHVLAVSGLQLTVIDVATKSGVCRVVLPSVFDAILDVAFVPDSVDTFVVSTQNATVMLLRLPPSLPAPSFGETTMPELLFDDVLVNRWRCELPFVRVAVLTFYENVSLNLFGASTDRETKFCTVDLALALKRKDIDTKALKMPVTFPDHSKRCTFMAAVDGRLLVTAAADGRVVVRNVSALANPSPNLKGRREEPAFVACRHESLHGGVAAVWIGSKRLLATGADGCVSLWKAGPLRGGPAGKPPGPTVLVRCRPFSTAVPFAQRLPPAPEEALFFLTQRRRDAEEVDRVRSAEHREAVMARVGLLRNRLRQVRAESDASAAEERVDTTDFLVQRDLARFHSAVDVAIDEMTDSVKWRDLEADYVTHKLRTECWDQMAVKLAPLYGMVKTDMCVYSCHRRATPPEKLLLLRKLKFLRRTEETDRHARKVRQLRNIEAGEAAEADESEEAARPAIMNFTTDLEAKPQPLEAEAAEDVAPFLYNPKLAFTRQRAITQIALLEAQTANILSAYNARFTELQAVKRNEIDKIRERNARCANVQKELEDNTPLFTVSAVPDENPNTLLEVSDAEVAADKSHDPAEKRRVAAQEAELERWRKQHGTDDSSERALKMWMDGRLEKEIKTLKVDVPEPDFAVEGNPKFVPVDERTDDHVRLYREYEKKLKQRTEEVAARRKLLQQELAALQKDNVDSAKRFDAQLEALMLERLAAMQRTTKVDLARVKLSQSIALQQGLEGDLKDVEERRAALTEQLVKADASTRKFRDELNALRDELSRQIGEEKLAEKRLRALPCFNGHEDIAERVAKLYTNTKKKAAAGGRGLGRGKEKDKAKGRSDRSQVAAQAEARTAANPDPFAYVDAEAEAKARAQMEETAAAATILTRLEKPPEGGGIPDEFWPPFLEFVQERVHAETSIKQLQAEVHEKSIEEAHLVEAFELLRQQATEQAAALTHLRVEARKAVYNTDDLRLYRQGQVEVPQEAIVTDYGNAVLIHSRDIEKLNAAIRERGNDKVAFMEQMLKKRNELLKVEWEVEKYIYQCQTLELECRHLHTLRVTKQMQEFIHGGGEGYNEREREKLHAKIEHVRSTMCTKIEEKKQLMAKVKRATKEREMENQLLLEQVGEAQTLVDSRRAVRDLQSSELEKERHNRLMRDMRVTRKLEDVAKAQQEEMAALRKEIDRLRERTFPSFAVVSKRVIGNPDEV